MQSLAAEQQHGQHHELRATVGDDGARDSAGNGVIKHLGRGQTAHLLEGFTNTVEDHDRFIDRVTQNSQHRRQH